MEVFSRRMIKLWEEDKLRILVLLSLSLQVILIFLGNRRKFMYQFWLRGIVWTAYLAADYVATVALGAIVSNFVEMFGNGSAFNSNIELTAFWAPFLLLHLGGPDTITSYSLEDNELWNRHLLGLAVQTGVAVYILLMSWRGSFLSFISLMMIFAGIIKYGERTWVLRSVSEEQLRISSVSTIFVENSPEQNSNLLADYLFNEQEWYSVNVSWATVVDQLPIDFSDLEDENPRISKEDKLVTTYGVIDKVKCLMLDVVLSTIEKNTLTAVFRNMNWENAWEVVSLELGFIYDLLYTKAMISHTPTGIALRLISFLLTCISLVLFSFFVDPHKYDSFDQSITYLLLIVGVILELYAALVQLSLDQTVVWLIKHNRTRAARNIMSSVSPFRNPEWSNLIGQYNLLSFSVESGRLKLYKKMLNMNSASHVIVCSELKKWIFDYLESSYSKAVAEKSKFEVLRGSRGRETLREERVEDSMGWATDKLEFEQSILIWHIATELTYHLEEDERGELSDECCRNREVSKYISRYMMYLLAKSPKTLPPPTGVLGRTSLEETRALAVKFYESFELKRGDKRAMLTDASQMMLKNGKEFEKKLKSESSDRTKQRWKASLLGSACELSNLLGKERMDNRWRIMSRVWMEMMAYAAAQCKGSQHSQQLIQGGELLTHVWLLMAHFGLTHHFQKQKRRPARLILT